MPHLFDDDSPTIRSVIAAAAAAVVVAMAATADHAPTVRPVLGGAIAITIAPIALVLVPVLVLQLKRLGRPYDVVGK